MKRILFLLVSLISTAGIYAQDTLSIDSVQWVSQANLANCLDESRYNGDTVVITGICLVAGADYGSSSHNIQVTQSAKPSPFGGIRFRQGNPNANYNVSIRNLIQGDSIIAIGTMSQYQGETQFEPLETNGSITILNRGITVHDTVLDIGVLNNASQVNELSTGEQWESSFVTIEDVTVISVDPFSGNRVSFVVADKNGNRINIGDHFTAQKLPQYTHPVTNQPGTFSPPSPGDNFASISGIIIHSRNCTGENGRGYELAPFDASHYVYGPSAPRIENTARNISAPTSSQDVVVSADIYDLDGTITNAELLYNTGTDLSKPGWTSVTMTKGTGNSYSATIPKMANGTFVRYYLTAQDDSSNTTTRPDNDPMVKSHAYRVRDNGLTIYDVQFTPFEDGRSVYENEEVTISGVVTASGKDGDLSLVHIQDPNIVTGWSGIILANVGQTFERDSSITVTGTVSETAYSRSTRTTMTNISLVTKNGTGSITPMYIAPDSFTTYSALSNEKYESVLVALINNTSAGNNKIHVVDTNADSPSNFAEYLVGRDPLDPSKSCRVIAGRSGHSSEFVSYVNGSTFIADSASYPVEKILVADTMNMDTLVGIMTETYGNMKLIPRNNDDFIGINVKPEDSTGTSVEPSANSNSSIVVYPNPTSAWLNIDLNGGMDNLTLNVLDMSGKLVDRVELQGNRERISVEELDNGLYFLQFFDANGNNLDNRRFIKQ